MASDPLSALFGSKVQLPAPTTVNATAAAGQAGQINQQAAGAFGSYAPGLTSLIQGLFNNAYPQVGQALNTNSSLGQSLATTGTDPAMTNAMNYYRQLGLQTAAATGAPVSSGFAQNLGGSLGVQQILQNQMQGAGLLQNVASQGSQLGMQMLQPSFGILNSSLTTPGQVMQNNQQNASTVNEMGVAQAQYNAQPNPAAAWMVNELATVVNTMLGSASGAAASKAGGSLGGMGALMFG